jgi:hypothetical protein
MQATLNQLSPHFDVTVLNLPQQFSQGVPKTQALMQRINQRIFKHTSRAFNYNYNWQWLGFTQPQQFKAWAAHQGSFDTVWINYAFLAPYLKCLNYRQAVVDTHDLFGDKFKGDARHGFQPVFYSTSPSREVANLHLFQHVIAIQEAEAAYFKGRGIHATALSHMHPIREGTPSPNTLGYIGADNLYNQGGLSMFLQHVLPYIPHDLHIAGTICRNTHITEAITQSNLQHRITLHDFVADPLHFCGQWERNISPHLGGTGQKIKVMDALSAGQPLHASPDAVKGIPPRYFAGIHTTPEEWVLALNQPVPHVDPPAQLYSHIQGRWDAFLQHITP